MHEVETGALDLLHHDARLPRVAHDCRTTDHVQMGQHAIEQLDLETQTLIAQGDRKGFGIVIRTSVDGRKTFQLILARMDLVAHIAQIAPKGSLGITHHQKGTAHVARPLHRELLRKEVERVATVCSLLVGRGGGAPVEARGHIVHDAFGAAAVVEVQQAANVVDLHLVGGVIGVDGERFAVLVKGDRHEVFLTCAVGG